MQPDAKILFEFVGIVLPISFIGLRILLDEIEETGSAPEEVKAKAYIQHVLAMVLFLAAAGWFAIIDILLSTTLISVAAVGYVLAGIGITIPVWLLWTLHADFDVEDIAKTAH